MQGFQDYQNMQLQRLWISPMHIYIFTKKKGLVPELHSQQLVSAEHIPLEV